MKIGFDGRFIRRGHSGDGVFSRQMLRGLARLDTANSYTVYLLEDDPFIPQDNFHFKLMPRLHRNSYFRFLLGFPVELSRNPVDIFHAVHTVPLRTGARVVLHLVEFGWILNPGDFPASRFFLSQLKHITRRSVRMADRIITATGYWKDRILEHFGVPEEKVVVIPHGIDERFLERCSSDEIDGVKRAFGIEGEYILSVGDLHPRKNLVRLIGAFDWMKSTRGIPHKLVIAGKALYEAGQIYERAAACRAKDDIVFIGYIGFEHLRALYQGAAVFAFPSLDEGFGLPVHEAMASRLPVVISDRGSLPEISGGAAATADPLDIESIGSAVLRIIEDPLERQRLVEKGLDQIKRFTWNDSCKQILDLYACLGKTGGVISRTEKRKARAGAEGQAVKTGTAHGR